MLFVIVSLDEQRRHVALRDEGAHRGVRCAGGVALGGVEDLREQREVAGGVQEDAGAAEHPVDGLIDVGLIGERFVPGAVRVLLLVPRARA